MSETALEVPDGATYGGYEITEIGRDEMKLWVIYEGDDLMDGWDQIMFTLEWVDGTPTVTETPVGLVPPETAKKHDSPGARESNGLYDLLRGNGVEFDVSDEW